jgi:histidine phosphotransferase ChpT
MTDTLHPRVLELIASRICHDLVSPVGAISNGVELVQDMPDASGEAMALIASSAQQAAIRLKAFRLSYGVAGTDKNVGFKDIRDAFVELIGSGHVKSEFDQDVGIKYSMPPRGFFKVLLNVLVLAEETTRGEGKIAVDSMDDSAGVKVTVTGNNAGFRDGTELALRGETAIDDLDPRSVHAYITGVFARHYGLVLEADGAPGQVVFSLRV